MGSQRQPMWVVVDTGSSNLAVAGPGVNKPKKQVMRTYDPLESNTTKATSKSFEVHYVKGNIKGTIVEDAVCFASADSIGTRVEFGVFTLAEDFFVDTPGPQEPFEGILGMAYPVLANAHVVPFFDALVADHKVDNVFGLQFCDNYRKVPGTGKWALDDRSKMVLGRATRVLTNGSTEAAAEAGVGAGAGAEAAAGQYYGEMQYTPIVKESYYNIHVQGITVDGVPLDLPCGAFNSPGPSLVDSGTTVSWVPTRVHAALTEKLGDRVIATFHSATMQAVRENATLRARFFAGQECMAADEASILKLPNVTFMLPVAGRPGFEFGVSMLPLHYLRESQDGRGHGCYNFAILPWCLAQSGSNLGMSFLNNVYAEFDRDPANRRLGFAGSACATGVFDRELAENIVTSARRIATVTSCEALSDVECPGPNTDMQTYIFYGSLGLSVVCLLFAIRYFVKSVFLSQAPPTANRRNNHVPRDGGGDDSDDELIIYEDTDAVLASSSDADTRGHRGGPDDDDDDGLLGLHSLADPPPPAQHNQDSDESVAGGAGMSL